MNELKNKSTILIIVALIIVCGGSFLGVRALSKSMDAETTAPAITYSQENATATHSSAVITGTPQEVVGLDAPADVTTQNLITTFPVASTAATTQALTLPTTAPTTTFPVTVPTTAETTSATTRPNFTLPSLPTTTKRDTANSGNPLADLGLAGYLFNSGENFFFTADDPWQRNFGYTQAFDTAAPFVYIYMDTMRAKFRYGNKDWMVQFWKGQYGLAFIGSEIGVYTKPLDRAVEYYDAASDEDALYMACTCYRNNEAIFSREYGKYWWCTGFIPGQLAKFSDRSELAVKCRITMRDSNMLLGFVNALKAEPNNLVEGKHYTVSGLDVFITWQ